MSVEAPERTEVTALLAQQWAAIAALVADLDETAWRTPSPLPGWTVFDVVAHVIGTESLLLGQQPPAADPDEEPVDVRTLPHVRNEIAVLNEIWVRRLRPRTGARLLELFDEVTAARRDALTAMDDVAWAAPTPSPVGEVSYGRFMRVRLFDCWMHELDIADALGRSVDEGGDRAENAFAEFTGPLPRVIAKAGKAPAGSRVAFEVTGPLARTLRIAVDGRAAYVAEFDTPATVSIRLDSGLLVRLGGGRTTADAHPGEVTVTGDEALGQRLLDTVAFTI